MEGIRFDDLQPLVPRLHIEVYLLDGNNGQ